MRGLVIEERVLLLTLLVVNVAVRGAPLINRLNFALQLDYLARLHLLLGLEHFDLLLEVRLAMLRL